MVYLNDDVLYSIFEELRDDKRSLYSCLLVDRTWCVTAVPILWKTPIRIDNPNYLSEKAECALFNVIYSHLTVELREYLKSQKIDTETYQHPSFNYINFWRHLNFDHLNRIIDRNMIESSNVSIIRNIRNEIIKLFINRDTKFTHLSIYIYYDFHQLHQISGTEHCFSDLESFCYMGYDDQKILKGLAGICNSIKKLVFNIIRWPTDNSGIIKLIEVQKNLNDVCIIRTYDGNNSNNQFFKTFEKSLIKHANTLKYLRIDWEPITRFLSYLVNLISLEIKIHNFGYNHELDNLKDLSLPILRILKVRRVSPEIIENLIESTKGNLIKINIDTYCNNIDIKRIIQTIYQNCPNLEYLKLSLLASANSILSEFKNLLIKCQFFNELVIKIYDNDSANVFHWDKLFLILTESSPISLFNFKFHSIKEIKLQDIILFLDNWKSRYPISLRLNSIYLKYADAKQQLQDYKTKGVIKKCYIDRIEI